MFRWFETRLQAFPDDPPERPPETLFAFYLHFVRPVWPAFAALLVAGFLGSVIEVALMTFVGNLVDLMRQSTSPATFISDLTADQENTLPVHSAQDAQLLQSPFGFLADPRRNGQLR